MSARRMGSLGCTGQEARDRLRRLLKMGLSSIKVDTTIPIRDKERSFIGDMEDAISNNDNFEPSYGQVTYAQDIFDRYCV